MGGGIDPQIESIVAARPDLVLLAGSTRGVERLQALGLRVLMLEPRTHADTQRVLRTVGDALGVPRTDSDRVWREIEGSLSELPSEKAGVETTEESDELSARRRAKAIG